MERHRGEGRDRVVEVERNKESGRETRDRHTETDIARETGERDRE